jgi:membrane fusion protein, type I secretion system
MRKSPEMTQTSGRAHRSLRRHVMAGGAVLLALLGGLGGWAATTELSGAVVASGTLVVDTNVKKVQHQTGGTVSELRVRDGGRVQAGDIVVRLDETVTRANLAIVVKSLDELAARQARLEAERDGIESISFPDALVRRTDDPDVERLISGERKLFDFRRTSRQGQKAQLTERIAQLGEEIQGLTGQAKAKAREIELISIELEGVRELWQKKLIPISRVTVMERDAVKLEGDRNHLIAQAAQAKGKVTETELQIIQIDQDLRTEVSKELREIQAKTAEFVERKVAAEDQLKRVDIRAPQDGFVHQLAMHTVGGVVTPGEPIMLIVPEQDELTVEARIAPQDIDQLRVGQHATLRFSTFNQRTTPEINGWVSRISADVAQDQKSGVNYYLVRLTMPAAEVARLGELKLIPGMPVEVFIQTGQRTVMSYLVKPLQDQIAKAFRER